MTWDLPLPLNPFYAQGGRRVSTGVDVDDLAALLGTAPIPMERQWVHELMELLPVGVYICDEDGRISYFNRRAAELWGRRPRLNDDAQRFCGCHRLFDGDGQVIEPDFSPVARALTEKRASRNVETEVERPDGTRIALSFSINPIYDADGVCCGTINVMTDVTEQRDAKLALERAKESAEAANRSKDHFLAVLSHELRTPLSPVLMTASTLAEDPELPRSVRDDMAMIRRNVELETKLIDDLLDINRITSGKLRLQLQPVDVNEEVRHVADMCRSQFLEKKIHLDCQLDPALLPLAADPARLQQALWNILKNAAKFTPEGGRVQIRTFPAHPARVAIQIKDNGIGIAPELLVKIFNAFEQGDSGVTQRSGGLGLGLAISKALIELHHGVLWAESEGEGAGAMFSIQLPACMPDVQQSKIRPDSPGIESGSRLRVLLVEDHADTARTLSRLLRLRGYVVQTAPDVATALDLLKNAAFDLVVSDIGLPDASGHDLIRQIRRNSPVRAIAMSGYGMEADIEKSLAAGFDEHLVKPVSVVQLEQAIQRVRRHSRPVALV